MNSTLNDTVGLVSSHEKSYLSAAIDRLIVFLMPVRRSRRFQAQRMRRRVALGVALLLLTALFVMWLLHRDNERLHKSPVVDTQNDSFAP